MKFQAKYPGRCAHGDRIHPGEWVDWDEDHDGQLAHVTCIDPELAHQPRQLACRDCWTIHAGACL